MMPVCTYDLSGGLSLEVAERQPLRGRDQRIMSQRCAEASGRLGRILVAVGFGNGCPGRTQNNRQIVGCTQVSVDLSQQLTQQGSGNRDVLLTAVTGKAGAGGKSMQREPESPQADRAFDLHGMTGFVAGGCVHASLRRSQTVALTRCEALDESRSESDYLLKYMRQARGKWSSSGGNPCLYPMFWCKVAPQDSANHEECPPRSRNGRTH